MKIIKIEDLHCGAGWRVNSFLKITTDDGIVGWSEYMEGYGAQGLTAVIRKMGERLIGQDPRQVNALVIGIMEVLDARGNRGAGPPDAPPLIAALANLWSRTAPEATAAWRQRFTAHVLAGGMPVRHDTVSIRRFNANNKGTRFTGITSEDCELRAGREDGRRGSPLDFVRCNHDRCRCGWFGFGCSFLWGGCLRQSQDRKQKQDRQKFTHVPSICN